MQDALRPIPTPISSPQSAATAVTVTEASQAGEARRVTVAFGQRLGLDETRRGELAIVATELATNLARHAKRGELIVRALRGPRGTAGVELLAIDAGPGIGDVGRAMADGFSTGGTAGTGMGAVRRLAQEFDVFSMPGTGTAVVARLWADGAPAQQGPPAGLNIGVVHLPKPGEDVCGDGWVVADEGLGRTVILVVDGLGHGPAAADAARLAERLTLENVRHPPGRIVEALHAGLRPTRGAAVAVAEIARGRGQLTFCGVGNVAASVLDGTNSRSLVSHNGTAGAEARRIQEFVVPWPAGGMLVMHSDGLATHWQLAKYPGLRARDPAVIAGTLYRDHRRIRDDVTVLVAKDPGR